MRLLASNHASHTPRPKRHHATTSYKIVVIVICRKSHSRLHQISHPVFPVMGNRRCAFVQRLRQKLCGMLFHKRDNSQSYIIRRIRPALGRLLALSWATPDLEARIHNHLCHSPNQTLYVFILVYSGTALSIASALERNGIRSNWLIDDPTCTPTDR